MLVERDVVLVGKENGEETIDLPITRLGNVEGDADEKDMPEDGDAIPIIEGGFEMKKVEWSAVKEALNIVNTPVDEAQSGLMTPELFNMLTDTEACAQTALDTALEAMELAGNVGGDDGALAVAEEAKTMASAAQTTANSKAPTSHASSSSTYGVATSSYYGHAMASGASPSMNGSASVGTDNGKYAREGHVHPSDTSRLALSGGTMTGILYGQSNTSYTTAQVRNIYATTSDLTAGSSSLTNGSICLVYE